MTLDASGALLDPYSNFIAVSRYARWRDDLNRRETWTETVDRYLAFMSGWLSSEYGYDPADPVFAEVREAILHLEVMPSMRALMTAGPALERNHIAAYNPVTGDTPVLTQEFGMVPIGKLAGTEATVLNVEGRWAEASFRGYGRQPVMRVTFRNGTKSRREIRATPDHRWVLTDGSVVPTAALRPGMRIPYAVAPRPDTDNIDYRLGVAHGLVYGDGTTSYSQERVGGYHIRLCGDHDDLLPYLSEFGKVCYPPSANGDPVVMLYGAFAKTHALKSLPEDETPSYVLGFIRGWLAADGSVAHNGQTVLCATDEGLDWLNRYGPVVGILATGSGELPSTTNFGDRKNRAHSIRMDRASLVADDFLASRKRERFSSIDRVFIVEDVQDLEDSCDVYCAEVPDTNTFTLADGLVTGNCSFLAVSDPRAFPEALLILMHGTGVGFSVARRHTDLLPVVPDLAPSDAVIVVEDSKEGWTRALSDLLGLLYAGEVPAWDLSAVRPAGARLRTFGGRASGPGPLDQLFRFAVDTFKAAQGRRLSPLECHDLMCKIGDIVVSGGVRRSALISLSDLNDFEMAKAKSGNWWEATPHRALANNSAVYAERPSVTQFLREWRNLIESQSGERGIFNLAGARAAAERIGRDGSLIEGTNPCAEIVLRDMGVCNLTEVVVRAEDTMATLKRKVRIAAILGTWQSTLTRFDGLRPQWRANAEEERLLGVSLTGIYGNRMLSNPSDVRLPHRLTELRRLAQKSNQREADRLGINPSVAVTTVKPSGTVSQLTGVSSGIHPWHSAHYVRTVRGANHDPLTQLMRDSGVPWEADVMKPDANTVFSFPVAAPRGAVTREAVGALDHLALWMVYKEHWADHSVSVTVNVRDDEWLDVAGWVFRNFDKITGISFLPHSDHVYQQAPYQEVGEAEYLALREAFPAQVRWADLAFYETEDGTIGSRELACSADGNCEAVDIVAA